MQELFTKYKSNTSRKLSATTKKPDTLRLIGDVEIRSVGTASSSRRVIKIEKNDKKEVDRNLTATIMINDEDNDSDQNDTLVDESPNDGSSRLLPMINCLDSTISSEDVPN